MLFQHAAALPFPRRENPNGRPCRFACCTTYRSAGIVIRCCAETVRWSPKCEEATSPITKGPDLNWPVSFTSRYKTGRLLGMGMQGVVLEAIDTQTGQRCAVKKLRKDSTAEPPSRVLGRLAAEAAALERLQHAAGVVALIEKYEDAVFAYLVLEIMEGGTLADALKVCGTAGESRLVKVPTCFCHCRCNPGAAATVGRGGCCICHPPVPGRTGRCARAGHCKR